MKKKLKSIISFLLITILAISISTPVSAAEIPEKERIKVTNELAIEMANNFAQDIYSDNSLSAANPMKIFDTDGKAIGYIVNYYQNDTPYGYVIFDTTDPSLVSEYSFGKNVQGPYASITGSTYALNSTPLIKTAPFTYGIIDTSSNTIINNYGETSQLPSDTYSSFSDDKKPSDWADVFLEIQTIYEDYNLVSTNHLNEFFAFGESYIEAQTGHYACAISALYACAAYYGALDYSNVSKDYLGLWNATGTTVSSTSNGITYGSTNVYNVGPGFVSFCSDKGISVSQRTVDNPSYSFFTNCIDGDNMAVVHCGIIKEGTNERSGHSMAVQGYATIKNKNSGAQLQTLMVFDGWNEYVRYLNLNFGHWTDLRGTTFNG
ncbi:hypothetical protein HMPREF9457_02428 [Dorea formicigenerans 4_6_53AFAA]|nr:hypothetical protein HMPREF9457_02428 [Dorea formicigenerans 4_6_53AFAA]